MKRSEKRLLVFIVIFFSLLLINSFVYSFLVGLKMPLFLGIVLLAFKLFFGLEKSRFRVTKEVVIDTCVFLFIYLLLIYLLGLVTNFARTGNYYTIGGFRDYILPIIFTAILREIIRYNYVVKSNEDKLLIALGIITFTLADISNVIYYNAFNDSVFTFKFIALTLLPAISFNAFATYVTGKAGYLSPMIYSLIIGLYVYLIPIIPDLSEYLTSIGKFLLPIIMLYRVYLTVKNEDDEKVSRDYNNKDFISLGVAALIIMTLVYFSSGYFKYYAIAIATGSMSPNINVGDVVIIKKTKDFESINPGDIIVYDYHDHLIVHRLVNKLKVDGKYYFYTKGDANKDEDGYAVEEEMVIGTTNIRIPYLGLPTVWLNELREE